MQFQKVKDRLLKMYIFSTISIWNRTNVFVFCYNELKIKVLDSWSDKTCTLKRIPEGNCKSHFPVFQDILWIKILFHGLLTQSHYNKRINNGRSRWVDTGSLWSALISLSNHLSSHLRSLGERWREKDTISVKALSQIFLFIETTIRQ